MQPGVGFEAETHAFASLGFVFPAETNVFQRKKGLFSPGQTTVCFARVGTSTRKENPGSLKHFFFGQRKRFCAKRFLEQTQTWLVST